MEDGRLIIGLLVVQILFLLFLAFIIALLISTKNSISLDKKFKKYTINPLSSKTISFSDRIRDTLIKLIKGISKILTKIKIFNKYSISYERHIRFEELNSKSGMDYVSTKLIVSFFLLLLYFITQTFQYSSITLIGSLLSFIIGFFIPDIFIQIEYKKKRKQIEEDLLKAIIIMNNAFKSGRSTMQAIEIVKEELNGAISDEFKKIYLDISYGLSLETVFERFYNRIKLEDAKYITSSLTLLNKTGGNIVKVFASVEREFFNKKKLANELKTMTSASVFIFKLLLCIPVFIFIAIFLLNSDYFNPLLDGIGLIVLSLILILYILYILTVKKVLRIDL